MSTIIIGTLVIGSMIFTAIYRLRKFKKGEISCGCGGSCSGCGGGCDKTSCCSGITIENKKK